jgi:hypothetical protein
MSPLVTGAGRAFLIKPKHQNNSSTITKDPYFSNVSLLLHMDGSNGSTNFIDSSSNSFVVTPTGNSQISTSRSVFGGASALFDGSGDYITSSVTGGLGSANFTLEFWFYAQIGVEWMFNSRTGGFLGDGIDIRSDLYITTENFLLFNSSSVSRYVWHHVAIVKTGNTITRYLDGVSTGTVTGNFNFTGTSFRIGGSPYGNIGSLTGNIDEFRHTKDIARYTSNFTPTGPFPNS